MTESARSAISGLLDTLRTGQPLPLPSNASDSASVIPPHLHDLQEADLPENQRGLVISEIELFRRRAVKKASSDKTAGVGPINAVGGNTGFSAPREPRERWGQRQGSMGGGGGSASGPPTPQHQRQTSQPRDGQFRSTDPQSYRDAPEFVKSEVGRKNDEERDRDLRAKKLKADDQEFKHVSQANGNILLDGIDGTCRERGSGRMQNSRGLSGSVTWQQLKRQFWRTKRKTDRI